MHFPLGKTPFPTRNGRVSLGENRNSSDFPSMEKSFRDILSEFLKEEESTTPPSPSENSYSEGANTWAFDIHLNQTVFSRFGLNRYPRPRPLEEIKSKVNSSKEAGKLHNTRKEKTPSAPEVVIPLNQFDARTRTLVETLIALGASELREGLSKQRIKRAYRRLAKRYHPDRLVGATPAERKEASAKFVRLQKAYEVVSEAVAKKTAPVAAAA